MYWKSECNSVIYITNMFVQNPSGLTPIRAKLLLVHIDRQGLAEFTLVPKTPDTLLTLCGLQNAI